MSRYEDISPVLQCRIFREAKYRRGLRRLIGPVDGEDFHEPPDAGAVAARTHLGTHFAGDTIGCGG